jgi:hypothetical protein
MIPDRFTGFAEHYTRFTLLYGIGFAVLLLLAFFSPHASAYEMVKQGQNVSQGQMYDVSGVYSWGEYQGQFAYWSHWWEEGTSVEPDRVITVEPRFAYKVYIDPSTWIEGNWYKRCSNCKNENNFAFKVIKGNSTLNVTPVATATTKAVAVMTAVTASPTPTTIPTTIATPERTQTPVPTTTIPTPAPTPTFPKPGLPLSTPVVLIGVVAGAVLFVRFQSRG